METSQASPLEKELEIVNELGLHARCAAMIAMAAEKARGDVRISKNGHEVDGGSTLDILSLDCPRGTRIKIRITDPNDQPVLEDICGLVARGFGEIREP
ncbi:MAG: HPr family phosphocarrier protein [Pseudomonadota bacterium]